MNPARRTSTVASARKTHSKADGEVPYGLASGTHCEERGDPPDSFGEFLAGLSGLFPTTLVSGTGWERLLGLARHLPIYVIDDRFGFEFDLCDPDPAADFCVVPPPGSPLAEFYVHQGELAPPESAASALGAFLAEQARDPQAFLAQGAGGVILEYDLAGISSDQPAPPGIFIVPRNLQEASGTRELFSDPEPLVTTLWAVAGWTPDAAILRQVRRIYQAMPPIGSVTQAGVLPGRVERALRLIIGTASCGDAVELLARLRWPGSPAEIAPVFESLTELTRPSVSLSVDVTAQGVSPRLGLEFHRPVAWYELDHSGWNQLIDRLTERGWCLPDKAHGLKAWPRVEQIFDQGRVCRVRQSINHVKVVVNPGRRITAKAYAGTAVQQVIPQPGVAS